MKIVIAPDKFKDSLNAEEVCNSITRAIHKIRPEVTVQSIPLADGGEGTYEILLNHFRGRKREVFVNDPLFRKIKSEYGISADGKTAFIEMARASGLHLLSKSERNPLHTSSIGTGELINDALYEGVTTIILGIGGSATNDAGIGMAQALGYRFYSANNKQLSPIGSNLIAIDSIDKTDVNSRLQQVNFIILCDVQNPLFGLNGAAFVYGPQKGATPEIVKQLDAGLHHFAQVVKRDLNLDLNFEGAGAAGGLGAGARLFLNASFKKGIEYISQLTSLEQYIKEADYVITGEGKVDVQSFYGKVVGHVATLCEIHKKPLIIVCGQSENSIAFPTRLHQLIVLAKNENEIYEAMNNATEVIEKKIVSELNL